MTLDQDPHLVGVLGRGVRHGLAGRPPRREDQVVLVQARTAPPPTNMPISPSSSVRSAPSPPGRSRLALAGPSPRPPFALTPRRLLVRGCQRLVLGRHHRAHKVRPSLGIQRHRVKFQNRAVMPGKGAVQVRR